MKKLSILLIANLIAINFVFSQEGVGINTSSSPADNSAILDVSAIGRGLLIPRMTTANRPANPVESLLIYNTDTRCFEAYNAKISQWVNIACLGNSTCGGTITDSRDSKTYNTVLIGTQCWFKENLNATTYLNGDAIPDVTDNTAWTNLTTGAYCNYDNDANNANTYGRLYNWFAVNDSRKLCPVGSHVPTETEWVTLIDYVGGSSVAGGHLKEAGTAHWSSPNYKADNSSGFTALPGGNLLYNIGTFFGLGSNALFWNSTEYNASYARYRYLDYNTGGVIGQYIGKTYGFSVRCIKD
jgi:uncharacterized protein (TIGR02145 family)